MLIEGRCGASTDPWSDLPLLSRSSGTVSPDCDRPRRQTGEIRLTNCGRTSIPFFVRQVLWNVSIETRLERLPCSRCWV